MRVRLEFKPQDLWIGVFWKTVYNYKEPGDPEIRTINVWICFLPMLPIHVWWVRVEV